jgi:pimeloyl-[acyl-carrier protein] synthase
MTGHGDGYEQERAAVGALFSEEGRRDPHGVLAALDLPTARFAVVERVLRDPAFLRAGPRGETALWRMLARWLVSLNGDRHRRLRQRFVGLFGPRTVERFREEITQRASALLDAVAGAGHMDVVTDFARPLPFAVITGVMGVPESDRPVVGDLLLTVNRGFAHQDDPDAVARGEEAVVELQRRFGELLDARARKPEDDLLSALAADAPADSDERADLLANCIFFVEAGHATTTSLIAASTDLLLAHPAERDRLSAEPGRIARVVEEVLRLTSPVSTVMSAPAEDVVLEGCRFAAHEPRHAFLMLANRDPAVFEGSSPLRPRPRHEPPPRVRGGPPLLPRRAPCPAARRDRADGAASTLSGPAPQRPAGLARRAAAARDGAPPGDLGRFLVTPAATR